MSWGCILLVLLCVVIGLIVVCALLINHERNKADLQKAHLLQNNNPNVESKSNQNGGDGTGGDNMEPCESNHVTLEAPTILDDDTDVRVEDESGWTATTVQTNCGIIKGSVKDGVRTFKVSRKGPIGCGSRFEAYVRFKE